MLPRRRTRSAHPGVQDLNVTPYMNLMAVLIPFMLSVAVFTRLAVLEIYLPPPDESAEQTQTEEKKPPLSLTVSIGDGGILVTNGEKLIGFIPVDEEGHQFGELSNIITTIKRQYPEEESAIILSKADTNYGTLVAVMDAVQTTATVPRYTLFPNISLGEVE